jgi:hypothetical protein
LRELMTIGDHALLYPLRDRLIEMRKWESRVWIRRLRAPCEMDHRQRRGATGQIKENVIGIHAASNRDDWSFRQHVTRTYFLRQTRLKLGRGDWGPRRAPGNVGNLLRNSHDVWLPPPNGIEFGCRRTSTVAAADGRLHLQDKTAGRGCHSPRLPAATPVRPRQAVVG